MHLNEWLEGEKNRTTKYFIKTLNLFFQSMLLQAKNNFF